MIQLSMFPDVISDATPGWWLPICVDATGCEHSDCRVSIHASVGRVFGFKNDLPRRCPVCGRALMGYLEEDVWNSIWSSVEPNSTNVVLAWGAVFDLMHYSDNAPLALANVI